MKRCADFCDYHVFLVFLEPAKDELEAVEKPVHSASHRLARVCSRYTCSCCCWLYTSWKKCKRRLILRFVTELINRNWKMFFEADDSVDCQSLERPWRNRLTRPWIWDNLLASGKGTFVRDCDQSGYRSAIGQVWATSEHRRTHAMFPLGSSRHDTAFHTICTTRLCYLLEMARLIQRYDGGTNQHPGVNWGFCDFVFRLQYQGRLSTQQGKTRTHSKSWTPVQPDDNSAIHFTKTDNSKQCTTQSSTFRSMVYTCQHEQWYVQPHIRFGDEAS